MYKACPVSLVWLFDASVLFILFFFNDTATTEIYTLSLHDALPICSESWPAPLFSCTRRRNPCHTEIGRAQSELQSPMYLVCRLLLEKKTKTREREASMDLVLRDLLGTQTDTPAT